MPRKNIVTWRHFMSQNFPYYNTSQPKQVIYKKKRQRCDKFQSKKKAF